MRRLLGGLLVGVLLATVGACSADESGDTDTRTLTVFAASSLTDTFTELGRRFESSNPGVKVTFSFAGSSDLVAQLQEGAPADVFASADTATMDRATEDDLVAGAPATFATNTLEIAVPPDNPAGVDTLADLADAGVKVVLCAPEVPCGAAAVAVQDVAGVQISPVSEEASVTDVLGKVTSGEADAGLVYLTDVLRAGDAVEGIDFPESEAAVNTYPVAVLTGAADADLASAFAGLVTGEEGRDVLSAAGFGPP